MSLVPQSHESEHDPAKANVLVIVALPEEFEYFVSELNIQPVPITWKHPYYTFEIRTHGDEIALIAIAYFDKMDSSYASTFTLELLQEIKPSLLVNVGISGIVDDDLHLGDVIVAQTSYNVTYRAKITGKKDMEDIDRTPSFDDLILGGDPINTYYSFPEIFTHFERTHSTEWLHWRNNSLALLTDVISPEERTQLEKDSLLALPTKVVVGPTATEPWVGASKGFKTWLRTHSNRNFLCMDTESWGVLHGARAYSPELKTLVLRGISDPADERKKTLDNLKNGAIRRWAISNAAQMLVLFIEHYWGDNFLPKTRVSTGLAPENLKDQLAEEIHKTCVRDFLNPYYNNHSRVQEHGYESYGDLFATICDVDDLKGSKFFGRLTEAVVLSANPNPVLIEGAAGTGKTALLSILYWFVRDERKANLTVPLPVFVDLHRYNETADERQAVLRMEAELSPLSQFIRSFPDEQLLIILDGFDEFARYKEECFRYLSGLIQESLHYKIIGSREAANTVWRETSRSAPSIVYQLNAIRIDDSRVKELINGFVRIWRPVPHNELIDKDLVDRLDRGLREAKVKWIDLFILSLVAENKLQEAFGPPLNLSALLDDYCRRYLRERLTGHKTDELMFSAATLAFHSQVEKQREASGHTDNLVLRDLAQKHSRISDYLTAYYVTHGFLALSHQKIFETEDLRYVYPYRVNRLAKELINSNSKQQIDFAQILDKFLRAKKVQNYAKAQACYLAGRLEDPQARQLALNALRGYKSKVQSEAERGRSKSMYVSSDPEEGDNDKLLLERTLYISMAFLGDERAETEYVDLLFNKPRMDLVNRGFHLEYYGDQPYDPTRPLTSADHLKACPKTFQKLIQNLSAGPEQNPIYEIELFTLCSLAQKRHAIHTLHNDDRAKILRLLKVITLRRTIKHNKLQIFVRMLIKHFTIMNFNVGELFRAIYAIKEKKRMGWVKRNKNDGESVADHSFGSYLIGLLFLPKRIEGNREYNKVDILNMLLIHDLAESITGDILPEDNTDESKQREREVQEEIGLIGTYDQFADTSEIAALWEEFEDRKTINGTIAKEIDKLENLVQLFVYRDSLTDKQFDSWKSDLLGNIKTDIGNSILEKIELMFPDDDNSGGYTASAN